MSGSHDGDLKPLALALAASEKFWDCPLHPTSKPMPMVHMSGPCPAPTEADWQTEIRRSRAQ